MMSPSPSATASRDDTDTDDLDLEVEVLGMGIDTNIGSGGSGNSGSSGGSGSSSGSRIKTTRYTENPLHSPINNNSPVPPYSLRQPYPVAEHAHTRAHNRSRSPALMNR